MVVPRCALVARAWRERGATGADVYEEAELEGLEPVGGIGPSPSTSAAPTFPQLRAWTAQIGAKLRTALAPAFGALLPPPRQLIFPIGPQEPKRPSMMARVPLRCTMLLGPTLVGSSLGEAASWPLRVRILPVVPSASSLSSIGHLEEGPKMGVHAVIVERRARLFTDLEESGVVGLARRGGGGHVTSGPRRSVVFRISGESLKSGDRTSEFQTATDPRVLRTTRRAPTSPSRSAS